MKITKAIIPAAGIGTRFLPWTKAMPKEMLPIVDKPVIQYVVEECVASGITEIIIVTSSNKKAIEDYFSQDLLLEWQLKNQGKSKKLKIIKKLTKMANFVFIRQKGPYGNATPILSARHVIGKEPFAVLWGDQFVWAKPPRLSQCLKMAEKYQAPVIAGLEVEKRMIPSKGMCAFKPFKKDFYQLKKIIEKPKLADSPSNLAAYGTYVLTPDIFPILAKLKAGKDKEFWLVQAINSLCKKRKVYVLKLKNAHLYDAGNKLDYHRTVIDFMLKDKEIGKKMKKYLRRVV